MAGVHRANRTRFFYSAVTSCKHALRDQSSEFKKPLGSAQRKGTVPSCCRCCCRPRPGRGRVPPAPQRRPRSSTAAGAGGPLPGGAKRCKRPRFSPAGARLRAAPRPASGPPLARHPLRALPASLPLPGRTCAAAGGGPRSYSAAGAPVRGWSGVRRQAAARRAARCAASMAPARPAGRGTGGGSPPPRGRPVERKGRRARAVPAAGAEGPGRPPRSGAERLRGGSGLRRAGRRGEPRLAEPSGAELGSAARLLPQGSLPCLRLSAASTPVWVTPCRVSVGTGNPLLAKLPFFTPSSDYKNLLPSQSAYFR